MENFIFCAVVIDNKRANEARNQIQLKSHHEQENSEYSCFMKGNKKLFHGHFAVVYGTKTT